MRGEISNMLENRMNNTMRQYEVDESIRQSWDIMQHDVSGTKNDPYIKILQPYV